MEHCSGPGYYDCSCRLHGISKTEMSIYVCIVPFRSNQFHVLAQADPSAHQAEAVHGPADYHMYMDHEQDRVA